MPQALLFDKTHDRIGAALAARCPQLQVVRWQADDSLSLDGKPLPAEQVSAEIGWISADVLGARLLPAYARRLAGLPSMRWTQSAHAGLDHPAYVPLVKQGVRLTKSGAQSIPITEYVLGYALAHFQDFAARRADQQAAAWKPRRFRELWHSEWLIVGYGHIGRGVARRAHAFDARITVVRQSPQGDAYTHQVVPLEAIGEHLPRADVVVLACPATERTRGMVDADFLGAMQADALLLNVARGSLVDETALLAALDAGRPAAAVLDVFASEPLPADSPLWQHPRVTVTAHTSNAGSGTRERGDALFLDNVERYLRGEALLDEVAPTDIVAD